MPTYFRGCMRDQHRQMHFAAVATGIANGRHMAKVCLGIVHKLGSRLLFERLLSWGTQVVHKTIHGLLKTWIGIKVPLAMTPQHARQVQHVMEQVSEIADRFGVNAIDVEVDIKLVRQLQGHICQPGL